MPKRESWKLPYEKPLGKRVGKSARTKRLAVLRVQGSHHIYGKEGSPALRGVRLSVPIHGNQPLKRGLLSHLLKMAGIEKGDL